jgi:hypothetical protein
VGAILQDTYELHLFQSCYNICHWRGIFIGDHHVWGHHPAPKWSFREEENRLGLFLICIQDTSNSGKN